ncbi:hypothetical protein [Sphaerisporangium rubeum]|uniref:Uncharacterized protein n=1 Tax=Sphaerisporangium rubeum TaxID=321317 RepID=A0A7X0ICG7_9ACTN|nr:hypothetical protein [Sphaerisporangium rubeum]MBB6472672.1 hypothetical protein [Sphaerisporangium rubeum]
MLFELTLRRTVDGGGVQSPIDGIRILALLPPRWRKDLKQATGDIVIRVNTDEDLTNSEVRAKVINVLANPEVSHWRLVSCHTLGVGPGPHLGYWITARRHGQRPQWN